MKTFAIDIRLIGKKRTGDETVFFHLTKEILAIDKENRYALVTDISDPEALAVIRERLGCAGQSNVEIITLSGKNRFVWNLFALPLFLLCRKIDVYHTQYILPFYVPARTKVVTHVHDVSFSAYPELIGRSDRFFLSLLIPPSLRRASLIAVPSQFTKDEIVKYYGTDPHKIAVIPNALGDDFLAEKGDEEKLRRVREKYHLPEKYLIYVGTLQPRKNIPFLIEAFALLKKRLQSVAGGVPDVKLVLVGNRRAHHVDARLDETLARLSMEGDVLFPGFVDQEDLPTVIRGASLFVFPSLYEGFGIPLLEAMSQEVPIAAADIPSLREVAGEAALYFDARSDPSSIASCAEKLYTLFIDQERKKALVQLGTERFSLFSWGKSAKLLLQAYKNLA